MIFGKPVIVDGEYAGSAFTKRGRDKLASEYSSRRLNKFRGSGEMARTHVEHNGASHYRTDGKGPNEVKGSKDLW